MMVASYFDARLIDRLPPVRGRLTENAMLDRVTWFRVGGPAEVMFRPADLEDLRSFMTMMPADVPITVIGVGSNLLVRDGGVPGVVIRLGREFTGTLVRGHDVIVGATALDANVAMVARDAGLAGLEFLSGIPGTIGGALRMNAGAYGTELKDVMVEARAIDGGGVIHSLTNEQCGFSYRHCSVPADWIFIDATLRAHPGNREEISRRIMQIKMAREETQPVRTPTGGSTFANPPGHKAWELIEQAGCRGLTRGGAMVSDKHCNFLINTGMASASDLEGLGEEVRRRVKETSGITLEWEIRRIGISAPDSLEPTGIEDGGWG